MDKSKTFVGQPVLSQILDTIPLSIINAANKKLPVRVHLVTLLYGVFTYCNGLRELCEGMLGCEGKLQHLGLDKAPARSTLSDAEIMDSWFQQLMDKSMEEENQTNSESKSGIKLMEIQWFMIIK